VIAVFFDSNVLFSENCFDYSKSWIIQRMEAYSDLAEYADAYDDMKFVIPEVVVEEIHRSQCEKYKNKTDDLKRIVLPDWKFEHNLSVTNYRKWLDDHFDTHCKRGSFGMTQFTVASIPETCFKSVVKRALAKKAPFEGKNKASDKGFKDALIWETLLQYKRDNKMDEIVLITKDDRLSAKSIKEEFENEFNGETIIFCSDPEEFQKYLNELNSRRGADAGLPLKEIEDSSQANEILRSLVFFNMEAIAKAGNLSYQSDTSYNLKQFSLEMDSDGCPRYFSTLWSTNPDGDSTYCEIVFRVSQVANEPSMLCLVDNHIIDIAYDKDSLEAIRYVF